MLPSMMPVAHCDPDEEDEDISTEDQVRMRTL